MIIDIGAIVFLAVIGFLIGVCLWPLSARILNWFQTDLLAEANAVLSEKSLTQKHLVHFALRPSVILTIIMVCIGLVLVKVTGSWSASAVLKYIFCTYLILLAVIDFRSFALPDILNYLGIWTGLILASFSISINAISIHTAVLGATLGYLVFWSLLHFGRLVLGKEVLGYGDCKFAAMLGAWLGFGSMMVALFIASCTVFLHGLLILAIDRRKKIEETYIPFGPHMVAGGLLTTLFKSSIMSLLFGFAALLPSI